MNNVFNSLVAQGLLRLQGSKHDKRIKRIHLTEEGERYRERMIAPLRQAEVRAMPTLEPAERRAMITYVDRFMNALEQQIDGIDA